MTTLAIPYRQQATDLGFTFHWEADDSPDLSWMDEEERQRPHEVLGCIVRDRRGEVLVSLWGITDADDAYAKEVEENLAQEAVGLVRDWYRGTN